MKKRNGTGGPQQSIAGQVMAGYAAMEKKDAGKDKKMGVKENSPKDMKMDAKFMKKGK